MKTPIPTDALVTVEDVQNLKAAINRGEYPRLVYELIAQEPELTIALSEKHDYVTTILQGATMSIKQRAVVEKQLSLLVWMPLLLLSQAHRRSWNDFLPSEEVLGETDDDGGVE